VDLLHADLQLEIASYKETLHWCTGAIENAHPDDTPAVMICGDERSPKVMAAD
jgi:hypothetical protein